MSRAIFNRMLLAIHGQGDELATPYFRTHCSGCTQGCELCENELALDVHPDAERVIAAPVDSPEDRIYLARVRRWAVARALGASAFLAGLLALFGAQCFKS